MAGCGLSAPDLAVKCPVRAAGGGVVSGAPRARAAS